MSYYHVCPCCGSNLDSSEVCDCQDKKRAAGTDPGGNAEQNLNETVSVSNDSTNLGGLQDEYQ